MALIDSFVPLPMQKHTLVQPDSPVYVHCSRRSIEKHTGASFVQVRMVNRSERVICNVFLRIEGLDRFGERCFLMPEVILADCNAAPHAVFGEERLLSIDRAPAERLCITVERVTFADGMIWRRLPDQKLMDASQWKRCVCAMPNPPTASRCRLCGRKLSEEIRPEPEIRKIPEVPQESAPVAQIPPTPPADRPSPIIREPIPSLPQPPKEARTSKALLALLIVLVILACLSVAGLVFYAFYVGLIPIENLHFFQKFFA